MQSFSGWLGQLFNQSELEIQQLLADQTAMQFLLAWSLFESKCFKSDLRSSEISGFASQLVSGNEMILDSLNVPAAHFHIRYQSPHKFANLMPANRRQVWMAKEFKNLLAIPFEEWKTAAMLMPMDFRKAVKETVWRESVSGLGKL